MILDGLLILCGTVSTDDQLAGQLVTSIGTTLSTNAIDLAPATRGGNQAGDYGIGEDLDIGISIMQTLTSGGAATVQFQLIQADNAALNSNVDVIASSPAYGFAKLTAGVIAKLGWEGTEPLTPRRYLGMQIVIATAALTNATGQFFSYIPQHVVQRINNRYTNSGYSIV